MVLFVLFEHASGYAIFKSIAAEEIGGELSDVQESVTDLSRFGRLLKLQTFQPFKTGVNALENINSISEGLLHQDLETFLEANVPMGKKASKVTLGVSDAKIGAAIQEKLHIVCQTVEPVPELLRGIRTHFPRLIKGLTGPSAAKAQLGLGHSYSRSKVKFNTHRVDNMIIQSIALLDQLDKDINTFAMRMREWYSYHFPELIKIVSDNYLYARAVQCIQSRKDLTEDKLEALEQILMDSAKARAVLEAARTSMGMDIAPLDLINIQSFANRVIALADYRRSLHDYLHKKMSDVAPNLAVLIGDQVGARLISHAGSLTNLAKYPASTVQILGAEKALFRALKTRGNTPKYGLIYHSTFIGRATAKNKGRVSRYLANKCSLASRIDCFSEQPTSVFGSKLREQIEERLQFYETGEAPRKNIDVMKEAIAEAADEQPVNEETPRKKKKKKSKKEAEETEEMEQESQEAVEEAPQSAQKKSKKKRRESEVKSSEDPDSSHSEKKSRKRKKSQEPSQESGSDVAVTPKSAKKKKKATQTTEE